MPQVPDPRSKRGKSYLLSSLLALTILGLIANCKNPTELRWCPSIIDVLRAFIFKSYENEEDFLLESRLNLENGQFG